MSTSEQLDRFLQAAKEYGPPPLPTIESIPTELITKQRWHIWSYVPVKGKLAKMPADPATGVSKEWPAHPGTSEQALESARSRAGYGVGYNPKKEDGFVFVDFDDCFDEAGELDPAVKNWLRFIPGYCEITPSGKGLRVVVRGTLPRNVTNHPVPNSEVGSSFEMYDGSSNHFVTITGKHYGEQYAIENVQGGIDRLLKEICFDVGSEEASGETTEAAAVRYLERVVKEAETLEEGRYSFLVRVCWWMGRILGAKPHDPRLELTAISTRLTEAIQKTGWTELRHIDRQLRAGMRKPVVLVSEVAETSRLVVMDLEQFLETEFPPRETFLKLAGNDTPILTAQSLSQIFAWRGTGKTLLGGALAVALASGTELLAWKASRAVRVLYIDGEMPGEQMQSRFKDIKRDLVIKPGFLRLVTVGQQPNGIPSLATAEGQKALEEALGETEVLILDSISTLAWMGTNDEDNWLLFLGWLNRLRNQKKLCVVFLHHAGKSGMQRGHSRSEDLLDLSLKLYRDPEDEAEWCKFKLIYDKIRGDRTGVRNIEAEFRFGKWTWKTVEADQLAILKKYREENPTVTSLRKITKDIGEQLGVKSYHTVGKLIVMLDAQQKKLFPRADGEAF